MPKTKPVETEVEMRVVILLDDSRTVETPTEIPAVEFGRHIHVGGVRWEHCDDAADGTWRYVRS